MKNSIWLYWGNTPLSFLRYMTLHSLSVLNPDKEVNLILRKDKLEAQDHGWVEKQDYLNYSGKNYIERVKDLKINQLWLEDVAPEIARLKASDVHTSDLLGWYLLAKYGGTVSDMDIIYIKPIPEIITSVQLIVLDSYNDQMIVSFMQGGACKFWEDMYNKALSNYDPLIYQSCGGDIFQPKEEIEDLTVLSEEVIRPFKVPHADLEKVLFWSGRKIPEECIGIHWYGGTHQHYNNHIDDSNFVHWVGRKRKAVLTKAIEVTYAS